MIQQDDKPMTAQALIRSLEAMEDDLGKGGRKLARFIMSDPASTCLLSANDVADRCGVHASSVVRLAQSLGLSGYKEFQSILQQGMVPAFSSAKMHAVHPRKSSATLRLALLTEAGLAFNTAVENAALRYQDRSSSVHISVKPAPSGRCDPSAICAELHELAQSYDGIILVAREYPAINNAVRDITRKGVPVVCLTSDLPSSGRTAYVGSDQFASGATAGWFCGRFLSMRPEQKVLLVSSAPFRCQLDRELGFRQTLRSEFPRLTIEEKVGSDDRPEIIYDAIRQFVAQNGPPAAIYNVSDANLGIGRAMVDENLLGRTVFLGHELDATSRKLLEDGVMDMTIGHDFDAEISVCVESICCAMNGSHVASHLTQSQIFTRHNCTAT